VTSNLVRDKKSAESSQGGDGRVRRSVSNAKSHELKTLLVGH
jgi:hypothetical protein